MIDLRIKIRKVWFCVRLLFRMWICYYWNLIRFRSADKAREANNKWLASVYKKLDAELEELKNKAVIVNIENMLLLDRKRKLEREVAALEAATALLKIISLSLKEED